MGININFAAILVAVLAVVAGRGDAATYVVGDSIGWAIPTGGASAYANWASSHVFRTGDILVFNFTTGTHDVATVTRAAFDSCSSNGPIALVTQGPANVPLNSTGTSYFICTFSQHCSLGQKLAINVSGASPPVPTPTPAPSVTPRPAPSPAPTPSGAPTPAPTPTPTPTPTPSPSPSPNPTPSPESTPSPGPSGGGGGGGASPLSPPSPPPGALGSPPSPTPGGNGNPPPSPSSAPTSAIATSLVVFASIAMGLAI